MSSGQTNNLLLGLSLSARKMLSVTFNNAKISIKDWFNLLQMYICLKTEKRSD